MELWSSYNRPCMENSIAHVALDENDTLTYFYPRFTLFYAPLYWLLVHELTGSIHRKCLVIHYFYLNDALLLRLLYCHSHLLIPSKQSTSFLKYVLPLSLCVASDSALCLPGPGDAKHPCVQRQHGPTRQRRHLGLNSLRAQQHEEEVKTNKCRGCWLNDHNTFKVSCIFLKHKTSDICSYNATSGSRTDTYVDVCDLMTLLSHFCLFFS